MGLGLSELLAPRGLARFIGIEPDGAAPSILRALGLREVAFSLARKRRTVPFWMRALDVGLLLAGKESSRKRMTLALAGLAGLAALDAMAARKMKSAAGAKLVFAVTIDKPPMEVYEFFRRFENLPRFMNYLESVEVIDDKRSRWTAKLPKLTWEAEFVDDEPGKKISWRAEGKLPFKGTVRFDRAPGRDSTEVRVSFAPPAAKALSRMQVKGDLRRLKQVMETGEVLFSDASAHVRPHPAQPSPEAARYANERAEASRAAAEEGGVR